MSLYFVGCVVELVYYIERNHTKVHNFESLFKYSYKRTVTNMTHWMSIFIEKTYTLGPKEEIDGNIEKTV